MLADSNITKRALASALKELMQEIPFQKISVADICEKCGMNRKSFYYHFQDKYELMNWIFDMDFIDLINQYSEKDSVAGIFALCTILYENREFYCNAFAVQGQNSLSEHMREIGMPILTQRLQQALPDKDNSFYLEFFMDAFLNAMFRWIREKPCDPPEKFLPDFLSCIVSTSRYIQKQFADTP